MNVGLAATLVGPITFLSTHTKTRLGLAIVAAGLAERATLRYYR